MDKQKYETPEMEIVEFETEDVIEASGGDFTPGNGAGEGAVVG